MSAPLGELHTLRDWLRWAVSRFAEAKLTFGHGTTNAYDEACYLLLHALHLPLDRLEPFLDARLATSERQAVAELLARRIDERVPAAYLTREAWLGDFRFYVDERVIIPRSHIAALLPDGLAPWIGDPANVREALDLCTGSGCLAILLAHAYPNADVDAVDISADALAVAQRNVSDYGLAERINLLRSDLLGSPVVPLVYMSVRRSPASTCARGGSADAAARSASRPCHVASGGVPSASTHCAPLPVAARASPSAPARWPSASTTRGAASASSDARPGAFSSGDSGTATAPSFAHAQYAASSGSELASTVATRSPRVTPSAASAFARRFTYASNARHESRTSPAAPGATTASRSGR